MNIHQQLRQQNSLITGKGQINLNTFKRCLRVHNPDLVGVWQMNRETLKTHVVNYEMFGDGEKRPHYFIAKSVLLHHHNRRIIKKKKHEY